MFEVRLILILVATGVITLGIWHYKHTLDENARLNGELITANATVTALDETARQNNIIYERERINVDEIDSAPESDDGPVAPVLRRTINRLQDHSQ